MRYHTAAPHVALHAILAVQHLRSHVMRRTASPFYLLTDPKRDRKTKVGRFQGRPGRFVQEKEIFWFDVSVYDAFGVALCYEPQYTPD